MDPHISGARTTPSFHLAIPCTALALAAAIAGCGGRSTPGSVTDSGQEGDDAAGDEAPGEYVVTSETGSFTSGVPVTISGGGFGEKSPCEPFRSSYDHPVAEQNFQQSGAFDPAYWVPVSEIMITLASDLPHARVTGLDSHRYYARLEYSERGDWEGGGYSAGVQTLLPSSSRHYMAWWDFFEEGFDASHMETGMANLKWIYISPGNNPHMAVQVIDGGEDISAHALGGVGGETAEEQDENLILPFGGGFYSRPYSWVPNYTLPIGAWYFVEIFYEVNSAPGVHDGWTEMRIDNEMIYRANAIDIFGTDAPEENFDNIRFGGNYGFDTSGETFHREYGDIYIDATFARVVLCETADFESCRHLELQVPTSWSDDAVTFTLNHGSFLPGDTVYLFVVDASRTALGAVPIVLE